MFFEKERILVLNLFMFSSSSLMQYSVGVPMAWNGSESWRRTRRTQIPVDVMEGAVQRWCWGWDDNGYNSHGGWKIHNRMTFRLWQMWRFYKNFPSATGTVMPRHINL